MAARPVRAAVADLPQAPPHELQARVDVAAAGAHDQALQGRHAHGRVHGPAVAHRRGRRPVAQVEHHRAQVLAGAAQVARGAFGDVVVARAVEAVPGDAVALGHLGVQGVGACLGRQVGEEGGVEDTHVRHLRQVLAGGLDAQHVGGVVQRRQRGELAHHLHHGVVEEHRCGEAAAAVDDAVAHHLDLLQQAALPQPVEHPAEGLGVVGEGLLHPGLLAAQHERGLTGRLADALHQALGVHLAGPGVEDLELHRRGAGVDDECAHEGLPAVDGVVWVVAACTAGATGGRLGAITRTASGFACWVNRCAHRGAMVCREKNGNRRDHTCVYHQWNYSLSGDDGWDAAFLEGLGEALERQLGSAATRDLQALREQIEVMRLWRSPRQVVAEEIEDAGLRQVLDSLAIAIEKQESQKNGQPLLDSYDLRTNGVGLVGQRPNA